jgi:hypothetical protein
MVLLTHTRFPVLYGCLRSSRAEAQISCINDYECFLQSAFDDDDAGCDVLPTVDCDSVYILS